ncbi:LuxR C-terminal-related transcriptional regulator [Flavobacterium sp. LHD-85]|uniref:helix-turn-helix transcriptional regulator n=1 Tax=Flavobacterium sp. LHD-85 TaxID=3071410 RepID=UPI0027E0F885|nr:LuxR C-terminal-related transcriptional regulator [Flavobacterium sp. LHD-85]MDQ6530904.1 LuxR C-terminal-related transcriptional regulator [Flavobacterium sp. LHD-85]
MLEKKSIVIGCDDIAILTMILSAISIVSDYTFSTVSVSRGVDLKNTINSLNPDLVILGFKQNKLVLNDTNFSSDKRDIPILYLTQNYECESLCWSKQNIVFTYPYNQIQNTDFLIYRIRSIFLLKKTESQNMPVSSFAEAAIQKNDSDKLSHYVMELDQKVEVLLKIKERISYLYPNVDDATRIELMSIVNSIKTVANDNKLWDDFKIYFEQSNPNFLLALAKKHPSLSSRDLKYCCYIKMNMSNNDITNLLGINQDSVRTHKYRLKKKLTLKKEDDIISYLRTVS